MKAVRWLVAAVQDRPSVITGIGVLAVGIHVVLSATLLGWPGSFLASLDPGLVATAISSIAAISAVVAGFAAVVVVFGLQANSPQFRVFRTEAAGALRSNWTSAVGSTLVGALLGWVSLATFVLGLPSIALFVLELGLWLLIHGGVRVYWLLHKLAELVSMEDDEQVRRAARKSFRSLHRDSEAQPTDLNP